MSAGARIAAEGIESEMIACNVLLETFPDTFNGRPLGLTGLANHENDVGLYSSRV